MGSRIFGKNELLGNWRAFGVILGPLGEVLLELGHRHKAPRAATAWCDARAPSSAMGDGTVLSVVDGTVVIDRQVGWLMWTWTPVELRYLGVVSSTLKRRTV